MGQGGNGVELDGFIHINGSSVHAVQNQDLEKYKLPLNAGSHLRRPAHGSVGSPRTVGGNHNPLDRMSLGVVVLHGGIPNPWADIWSAPGDLILHIFAQA